MSTQQQIPARAMPLFWLWKKLGDAPMSEPQFLAAITRALERGPGAEADASAWRHQLTASGAVKVTNNGSGEVYVKADEFPVLPADNGPGSDAYDQQTAELAARQQEELDRQDAEVERNSPQQKQRAALLALIDSRIDARIAELRRAADGASVTRARELIRQGQDTDATAQAAGDHERSGAEPG